MLQIKKCYEIAFESTIETTPVHAYVKKIVKFTLEQATKAESCNSTLSLTSALCRVGGQRHPSATLSPGKRAGARCIGRWMVPEGPFGRVRKI